MGKAGLWEAADRSVPVNRALHTGMEEVSRPWNRHTPISTLTQLALEAVAPPISTAATAGKAMTMGAEYNCV